MSLASSQDTRPLVLHVIHHLVVGGMENGLVNLVNEMEATRFRHTIACVEDYSAFRERVRRPDVEVLALHRSATGPLILRGNIFRLCRRLRPTIVHSRGLSGLDAPLASRLAGVRHCVHGEHGWDVGDLHGEKFKPALLRRLHSPLISRYVTVSDHLAHYLIERIRIAPSRITLIRNGVDTDRFRPSDARPVDLLPPRFVEPGSVIIGTVGRIQPVKDQATLIRAIARVSSTNAELASRVRLAIVGEGPLLKDLIALAESLGLSDVAWFPGSTDRVSEILRAFDVFVLPSLAEGISNTILEAMACGVPVLATARGGNLELVVDGTTGRLFEPGDIDTLSGFLVDYLQDPSTRLKHGRDARARAVGHFGLEKMVAAYQALYEELASR